ncbi:MAG: helix-turn-helix transcriptional regulator [Planctomycetes bacterium]|nr:helix-turn-helix transcriptional regulator [Planctomycetota bacterium]
MIELAWGWSGTVRPMDLARWRFRAGQGWGEHRHAFLEVFWVERGRLRHRVDGTEQELAAGSAGWIGPGHGHWAEAVGGEAVLVNCAVRAQDWDGLRARWEADATRLWQHGHGSAALPPGAVGELARLVDGADPQRAADRDLLLTALARLLRPDAAAGDAAMPERLRSALRSMAVDQAWSDGVAGLAARAGLSREHLSRQVRRTLGCTAADLLLHLRLQAAARALASDARPVAVVAGEFGFASSAHFSRHFRARFGATPHAWRRRAAGEGPGPEPRCPPAGRRQA